MKKKRVFRSLVGTYIFFSIFSIVFFIVAFSVIGIIWSSDAYGNNFPYRISTVYELEKNLQDIYAVDGWVEALDVNYDIHEVYGNKQTELQNYQEMDLLELTDGNQDAANQYRGFLVSRTDEEGYFLFVLNRNNYIETHMLKVTHTGFTEKLQDNGVFVIVALGLYVLMCTLMGVFIHYRYVKPLGAISEGIRRMKSGDDNVQVQLSGAREFTDIRDAFNMMSCSLQIAKEEKAEAEYRKDKMLLNLSHDIRTPIATISSCAQALEEEIVEEEDRKKYYHIIGQKANRVSSLTEDMFTLLKMGDGNYSLVLENKDICEFLRELCIEYYVDAENCGMMINANIPEEEIKYRADYRLLSRAIGNLLTNAIKYNKSGRNIGVTLEQADNKYLNNIDTDSKNVIIKVQDDGSPIEKDLIPHLFDEFSRGDLTRKTTGGTGLGLSITRAIIEKHGGSVEYRHEGGCNCFELRI